VRVTEVRPVTVPLLINLSATVYPRKLATVIPEISAPIREIRVRAGDHVEADEIVAVLDNRDLLATHESALAALEDARANLRKTLSFPWYQTEGDRARRAAPGVPGAGNLVQAPSPAAQAMDAAIASAQQRVHDAQERLDAVDEDLKLAEIRSPIAGIVLDQFADVGRAVGPSAAILTIADISFVTARAPIPADMQQFVKTGLRCSFTPQDSRIQSAFGRIVVGRGGTAGCEMPYRPGLLPRQVGNLTIDTEATRAAIVVPHSAVRTKGDMTSVLVVDANHIAHMRAIKTSATPDGSVIVESGLTTGDLIVTDGTPADGVRVKY
jgi:multidrug efflux pump subunit AcrA (membrane-fusion protein)